MTRQTIMFIAAAGSVLLLGGAFGFQAFGYAPCKMCLWQRWPHAVAILLGIVAVWMPTRTLAALGALAMAVTGGLGIFHTGVERGWWEGPSSCTGSGSGLGGLSGADLLSVDAAPGIVMCDEVAWSFATLSMASWNAVFSIVILFIWLRALRTARSGGMPQ